MSARVRVKICGLTNEADARTAIALGADALGFNLFPSSPRCVDLADSAWIAALPIFVTRVAVLVNVPLLEARRVSEHAGIDLVQFHGDEDVDYCAEFAQLGRPFLKAIRVRDASSIEDLDRYATPHILLDAHAENAYGGTGLRLDASLAAAAVKRFPDLQIVLAGGLKPDNVRQAVQAVNPYAVDVASGVESSPGHKDREKMAAFIAAVGEAK